MRAHVEKATWGHVQDLAPSIRQSDVEEVWASSHVDAETALKLSFSVTTNAFAVVSDTGPTIAIFGCSPGSSILGVGVPWLLGSDDIISIARQFLRQSKPYVKQYFNEYRILENYVSVKNRISVRWLRWCGFHMDEARPYGPDGELFYRFFAREEDIKCV